MNKQLLEYYIAETEKLSDFKDSLNQVLESIAPENHIWSLVPESYQTMVLRLLQLTPEQEDWLSWWMYESTKGVSDTTGCMDLDSFDDFYAFVFEHKTVAEIEIAKSGAVS